MKQPRRIRLVSCLVLLWVGLPPAASAQTIRGLVLERATNRPIELASIVLIDAGGDTVSSGLSGDQGFYSVDTPEAGEYRLIAHAPGYRRYGAGPIEVTDGGVVVVEVTLDPQPIPIPGVDVETDAPLFEVPYLAGQGFYERRKMGIGHFMDPEHIAREMPLIFRTEDLFQRIPGVFVRGGAVFMVSTNGGRCGPTVFVDGVRVRGQLDRVIPLDAIEAVEIYNRPVRVPLQYLMAAQGCGVILFWTKH